MKTTKITMMAIALALSAAACNNPVPDDGPDIPDSEEQRDEDQMNHHNEDNRQEEASMQTSGENMTTTDLDEETTKSLTTHYLDLKQTLVESDAQSANSAAKSLVQELDQTDDDLGRQLLKNARHIEQADGIEDQREHFEPLSEHMYQLASQVNTGQDLYWQHCPMAMNNRGANWLSDNKEIRNPYFGDRMLKCGKVVEEI